MRTDGTHEKKDRIHWARIAGAGFVAELAPFLLLVIVASLYGVFVKGVSEPDIQRFAERAGDFVGPIGGAVSAFVCARWAASRSTRPVLHGVLVGVVLAILGSTFLVAYGASFRWLFILSYGGKLSAASLGGWLGARSSGVLATSLTCT